MPRLDDGTTAVLEQIVAEAAASGRLPSIVAAGSRHGEICWQASAGSTAARDGAGFTASQYRIGSITKTFTAVSVIQLRDEGLVDLSDPIARYVPDSPLGQRSVRSMLAHSSGMTAEPAGPWWERTAGGDWSKLATANATSAAVFGPGERYHYSNLGYALLGELVARIRGVDWWDAVSGTILQPLGLRDTTYHPRGDAVPGTSRDPLTGQLMEEPAHDAGAMAPAGQLWSTAVDLARWADVLAAGHPQVLSHSSAAEMRTVQSGDPDEQHRGAYGLGLRLRWQPGGTLVGHTGSMPGFLAAVFVDPLTRVASVLLTNATTGLDPETVAVRLLGTVSDGLRPAPSDDALAAEPAEPAQLGRAGELGGHWYWGNTQMTAAVTPRGFTLRSAAGVRTFEQVGVDRFRGCDGYFAGEDLRVVRRGDRSLSHLAVVTFVLTRRPYDPSTPIPGGQPQPLSWPG